MVNAADIASTKNSLDEPGSPLPASGGAGTTGPAQPPTGGSGWRNRIAGHADVDPVKLVANPLNWRIHPRNQQMAMAAVLSDVGWVDDVIVNAVSGNILDGHLRVALALSRREPTVPVKYVELDFEEEQAVLATFDPLGAMASADREQLNTLLQALAPSDPALGTLIEDLARENDISLTRLGLTDPDEAPPPPAPHDIYIQPGDLWLLGDHRLLCGDASEESDLRRLMGNERADCLWTDPPYGVQYVGKTADALTIQNDGDVADLLVRAMFEAARELVVPGCPFYCAAPSGSGSVAFRQAISAAGWRLHQELVWAKDVFVLGHSDYQIAHESILYGYAPGAGRPGRGSQDASRWYGDNRQSSVLTYPRPKRSAEHPTMKPVALIAHCLSNSTPAQGKVLDPFVGSGSTILAAEQLGRRCFAIDVDPAYVQVAIERWEAFAGEKAVKTNG
jgi:DNA modification methylase